MGSLPYGRGSARTGFFMLTHLGPVELRGDLKKSTALSGVAVVGEFLVVGSDETAGVQVLMATGKSYKVLLDVPLCPSSEEIDIESIAAEGNVVYVTGSHSRVRVLGKDGTIGAVELRPSRDRVFRFTLDFDGTVGPIETRSLRATIDTHPVLGAFAPLAGKENGVDIEGLAAKDGFLYFGFRGPVLRGNRVPVLIAAFDEPEKAKTAYVALDGRGIRDLVAVRDGFLVLAGPMGDGDGSFRFYFWNGLDLAAVRLAKLRGSAIGKPEGVALLNETDREYELLVICDGLKDGGATRWRLQKA